MGINVLKLIHECIVANTRFCYLPRDIAFLHYARASVANARCLRTTRVFSQYALWMYPVAALKSACSSADTIGYMGVFEGYTSASPRKMFQPQTGRPGKKPASGRSGSNQKTAKKPEIYPIDCTPLSKLVFTLPMTGEQTHVGVSDTYGLCLPYNPDYLHFLKCIVVCLSLFLAWR